MEVKIHSKLRRLERGTKCASFEHKTPAGIIRDIVQGYNLNADVEEFGPEYSYIEQSSYTDHGYILYLAGKYGKSVYCNGNTVHVKTEITPTDDDVVLEWGKTIISARTKADLAAQLSAVTATGWDMRKCSGFTATATMKDVPLKIGGEYCWEDNSKGYDPPTRSGSSAPAVSQTRRTPWRWQGAFFWAGHCSSRAARQRRKAIAA